MEKFFPALVKCPLFAGIEPSSIDAMLSCLGAVQRRFAKGENILCEGDPAKWIGVVLSGSVQVFRLDYGGNRSLMAIAQPTEIFAEAFACAHVVSMPVSVSALEDCDVLLVDAERITRACAQACSFHQQVIYNLMRILALKNLACNQKIEVTGKRSTRDKLMAYLMLQAKQAGSNTFTIPFDRQALADYLEVDRSGLSAQIGRLRIEGILTSERNRFTLLRLPAPH